jgi:TIR domain-containing protein
MQPTQESMLAYKLGVHFQHLNHEGFKQGYDEWRKLIQGDLDLLGVPVKMPATVGEYDTAKYEIIPAVRKHFERLREKLGGDLHSLPMFDFGYMPLDLVIASYYRLPVLDQELTHFASVLRDFRIETPTESLERFLARETAWLMKQPASRSGSLDMQDAVSVALRLTNRVTQLARAADKVLVPVHFDNMPYRSVFISYSTEDVKFAEKLYHALSEAGIRAWFAPRDMVPGKKLHHQIHEAIDRYDKLLLVISEASMKSDWVGAELFRARERERKEGVQMLFPVRIVPYDMITKWRLFDADGGRDLAREVREYYIADFSQWTDDWTFLNETHRLVAALMMEDDQLVD